MQSLCVQFTYLAYVPYTCIVPRKSNIKAPKAFCLFSGPDKLIPTALFVIWKSFELNVLMHHKVVYDLESCSNEIQQQPLYLLNTCFLKGQGIHLKYCHIFNHLSPYSQRSDLLNGLQSTSKFKKVVFA